MAVGADATVLRVASGAPTRAPRWVALPDFDGPWSARLDLRELDAVVEPSLAPGASARQGRRRGSPGGVAGPSGSPGTSLPSVGDAAATTVRGALGCRHGVLAAPATVDGDSHRPGLPGQRDGTTYRTRHAARAGVPSGPEVDRYLRVDRLPPTCGSTPRTRSPAPSPASTGGTPRRVGRDGTSSRSTPSAARRRPVARVPVRRRVGRRAVGARPAGRGHVRGFSPRRRPAVATWSGSGSGSRVRRQAARCRTACTAGRAARRPRSTSPARWVQVALRPTPRA